MHAQSILAIAAMLALSGASPVPSEFSPYDAGF
jgi:hypothetical protein